MATKPDTTMTDVDTSTNKVNSGTAIEMNCTSLKWVSKEVVQADQVMGQDIENLTHNNTLPRGDSISQGVPTLTLAGVVDLGDKGATANYITVKLLLQMRKSGHKFKLIDIYQSPEEGDEDETTYYRIHTLSGSWPSEVAGPIYCMVAGLTLGTAQKKSDDGQRIDYTLTLKEVRS